MCQICGYSDPFDCIMRIRSAYGPGLAPDSTPGRNIGSMDGGSWYRLAHWSRPKAGSLAAHRSTRPDASQSMTPVIISESGRPTDPLGVSTSSMVASEGATSFNATGRTYLPAFTLGPMKISGIWLSYEYGVPWVVPVAPRIQ